MTTVARLIPADWAKIEAIVDARKTFQGEAIDDAHHQLIKQHGLFNRLTNPSDVWHGVWDGSTLLAFTVSRRIPRFGEYCLGFTYVMPGLPKDDTGRSPVFVDLRNGVIDFFRREHMHTIWRTRPNNSKWSAERPRVYLSDPTKFSREDVYTVPAGTLIPDAILQYGLFIGSKHTLSIDQLITKHVDLNPIPWPNDS